MDGLPTEWKCLFGEMVFRVPRSLRMIIKFNLHSRAGRRRCQALFLRKMKRRDLLPKEQIKNEDAEPTDQEDKPAGD